MTIRTCIATLLCACAMAVASCTHGSPIAPEPSTFSVLKSGNAIGVSAPAGSADAGTTVTVASGGSGSGTAAADGSVAFNGTVGDGALTLSYTRSGQPLVTEVTVAPLDSLVSKPLFSTGSAPNDMELLTNHDQQAIPQSLYIANSLDNTVVQYAPDGTVLSTATFPPGTSPSYVSIGDGETELFVTANGNNILYGLNMFDLSQPTRQWLLGDSSAAFIGPGKPLVDAEGMAFVPRAEITGFGPPTVYGDSMLEQIDLNTPQPLNRFFGNSTRHNGVYAGQGLSFQQPNEVLVVSAGELQFDVNFHPIVTSNSYLTFVQSGVGLSESAEQTLSLGPIGASILAVNAGTGMGYLANLIDGNVYKVDLVDHIVLRGKENPIHLTDEFTYIGDVEFVPGTDLLLASSFNTDEVYVIDTATDTVNPAPYPGPFDMSLDPQLLAGTSSIEVDNAGHAYVLYAIANAVARIDLLP